jgi:hypothetical protein
MALTPAEEAEAKRLFIESRLSPEEKRIHKKLKAAREKADNAELAFRELRKQCPHPLIARTSENHGNSGNWDRSEDSYWTNHICGLCNLRWSTGQRWKYVGGKIGHPDDPEAQRD